MLFISMMLFFFVVGAIIEKYNPPFGHETCATILVGICFSFAFYNANKDSDASVFKFDEAVFFNFFLPPIIFNSGFNMRRRKFF